MGFFDHLVLPEEPAPEAPVLARLRPPGADDGRYAPPADRFVPARLSGAEVVGAGPETRTVLTGWSVWPSSATLHLTVFRNTRRPAPARGRQSGLRVGLLFSDGRRVTSLDGTVPRRVTYRAAQGRPAVAQTDRRTGLIPLDPGLQLSRRSLFRTEVELYLPELPPPGETRLVIEWPDEAIAETHTPVDAAALRAASGRAREVWPGLEAPQETGAPRGVVATAELSGPPGFLAPPLTRAQRETLRRAEEARRRYVPRADWAQLGPRDWADPELIRARLAGGAPLDSAGSRGGTPLHQAARWGGAPSLTALLAHLTDVDPRDEAGLTPLWYAVHGMREDGIRTLIGAGADVWTPQQGEWSPGRLLLTTHLAHLVRGLPGAVEPTAGQLAAQRAADALIAAFGTERFDTEGLGVCFVRGLDEDELIRRLGADPGQCPTEDYADAPFDELDLEESLRHVGVAGVPGEPGGCVVTQLGYAPHRDTLLRAVSAGTSAYGLYFNPKGGTFGRLARDGAVVVSEEIGIGPHESDPGAYWTFHLWQGEGPFPYGAPYLAYGCAAAGLSISDGRAAAHPRTARRWVELPPRLRD